MPRNSTVHHLACTVQQIGQVFTFARVGWWNIVQVTPVPSHAFCVAMCKNANFLCGPIISGGQL